MKNTAICSCLSLKRVGILNAFVYAYSLRIGHRRANFAVFIIIWSIIQSNRVATMSKISLKPSGFSATPVLYRLFYWSGCCGTARVVPITSATTQLVKFQNTIIVLCSKWGRGCRVGGWPWTTKRAVLPQNRDSQAQDNKIMFRVNGAVIDIIIQDLLTYIYIIVCGLGDINVAVVAFFARLRLRFMRSLR